MSSVRPSISLFSRTLIWCKLIAPHIGDAARLVSIPIMAPDSATGNTLPICARRVCQMIGVYAPRPPRRCVCHSVTSSISITHWGPRLTSPHTRGHERPREPARITSRQMGCFLIFQTTPPPPATLGPSRLPTRTWRSFSAVPLITPL